MSLTRRRELLMGAAALGALALPHLAQAQIDPVARGLAVSSVPTPINSYVKVQAWKILRGIARSQPIGVMGTAPTYTGPFTTSGISGAGTQFPGANIGAAGSGYVVGDFITAVGGTYKTRPAKFYVNAIGAGGSISAALTVDPGDYTTLPASTPVATMGGTGSGATIICALTKIAAQAWHSYGPNIHPLDYRITQVSGVWAQDLANPTNGYNGAFISRTLGSPALYSAVSGGTNGLGLAFITDSETVDVCMANGAYATFPNDAMQVYITDLTTGIKLRAQAADFAGGQNFRYYQLDSGSHGMKQWEFRFHKQVWVRGFNIEATAVLEAAVYPDEVRALVITDSYGEGVGCTYPVCNSYVYKLGETIGAPRIISNGQASSGVTTAGTFNSFGQRVAWGNLAPSLVGNLDLVFLWPCSINDFAASDATVQAGVTALIQAIIAVQPTALIVCSGPQFVHNGQTSVSRYAAVKAGVAAVGDPRVIYLDNSQGVAPWQTGTGYAGATTGSGNGDNDVSSDGTHPTDIGHQRLAQKIGLAMGKALLALVS
jgi:hypothetical protein